MGVGEGRWSVSWSVESVCWGEHGAGTGSGFQARVLEWGAIAFSIDDLN